MKYEKYLPIGSVVLLKNGKKRLMITGFCVIPNDSKEEYDYSGCLYPEGIITSDEIAVFNHNQIAKVYSAGYSDDEEKEFKKNLKEMLEKKNNE